MKTKSFMSFVVMAIGLLFSANSSAQTYCYPTFSSGCAFGDYLDDVTIGSFTDLSTGCSTGSVYDGTSDTIQVNIGDPVSLSLTSGYASHFYGIWIDYNSNGSFDSTEFVWNSAVKSGAAGTATSGSFTIPVSVNTGVYRLRVIAKYNYSIPVYAVDGCGSFTYGESHDYSIKINSAATCPAPYNIAYSTTDTSVALSWSFSGSSVTDYTVNYGPSGFTQGTGSFVTVSTDSAFITNLNSNTEYDFYVIANCSSTESSMANSVIGVKTQCPPYFLTPYFEDFESSPSGTTSNPSMPDCWTSYKNPSASTYSVYTYVYGYSFYSYSGNQSLNFSKGSGSGDTVMAVLPPILGLDSATKMLEFYSKKTSLNYDGKIVICALNSQADIGSLKVLDSVTVSSTSYEKYTLYLDASTGISSGDDRIAFMSISNGSSGYRYIDDVTIKNAPLCPSPLNISLDASYDNSVDLSWKSSLSSFELEYGPVGFVQGTGSSLTSATNTVTLSGLSNNSYYDVYIRSSCTASSNGYSSWEGPLTIRTACSKISLPYLETFDNDLSGNTYNGPALPDCWEFYDSGSGVSGYNSLNNAYSFSGSNSLYFYASSWSGYDDTLFFASPRINGLDSNNREVVFKAKTSNTTSVNNPQLYIGVSNDQAAPNSVTIIDSVNMILDAAIPGAYQDYAIELDNVPVGSSRLVFMIVSNGSLQYINVDDVQVNEVNPCKRPSGFVARGVYSTSLDLEWIGANSSNYEVKYGQNGFDVQTSGSTISGLSQAGGKITGLLENTSYDIYLRGDCSISALGYSNWVGPVTITTQCSDYSGALVEGFESSSGSYNDRTPPTCWTYKEKSNGAYGYIYSYGSYSHQGTNSYRLYASSSGSQDTALLASPSLGDLSSKSVELEFWLRPYSLGSFYRSVLHLVAIDSTNEFSSVQILDSIAIDSVFTGTQFQKFTYRFDSIQDASKIGFMLVSNSKGQGAYIDDVFIRDYNPCLQPSPITAYNITDTTASFALTSNVTGDSKWIEYGTFDFVQGTGVLLGRINTTNDSVSISSLTPNSMYQIRYKDSCELVGTSYWTEPVVFETECYEIEAELSSSSSVFNTDHCSGDTLMISIDTDSNIDLAELLLDGLVIASIDSLSFKITSLDSSDIGNYSVRLTNRCDTQLIALGTVDIIETAAITSSFLVPSFVICEKEDLSKSFSVSGEGLSFAWYKEASFYSADSALSLSNASVASSGSYQLVLSGTCGVDSSQTIQIVVHPETEVFVSSGDTTTCIGSDIILSIQDTGYLNTYQWFYKGNVIANATNSSYALPSISSSDTGAYSVEISGTCGSDTSVVLPVYVFTTTDILTVSSDIDACIGDQVVMNVDAIAESISYSWMKDGQVLPGATTDSLVLNNIQSAFAGNFTVEVSGICGTVISDSVQLSIHQSPNITTQPISDTLCQYSNTTLITGATGFGATYDWYYNGVLLDTGSTLQLDSIRYAQSGDYQAVVVGLCGVDSSVTANILVDAILPSVSVPSNAFDICAGDTLSINATSLLGKIINAEWYKDSSLVSTAKAYGLIDSGSYYVRLTDSISGCVEQTPMIHVGVNPVPEPVSISGEDTLYQNLANWYWVTPESGVDYSWSIPTGVVTAGWFSDSVLIKFSGSGLHMIYMTATNQFDCTTELTQEVLVSGIGIADQELVVYKLYPNPTQDKIHIDLDHALFRSVKGSVVNVKGIVLSEFEIEEGRTSIELDMARYPSGQYQIIIPEYGIALPFVKAD